MTVPKHERQYIWYVAPKTQKDGRVNLGTRKHAANCQKLFRTHIVSVAGGLERYMKPCAVCCPQYSKR